jgi:hypothetical protein
MPPLHATRPICLSSVLLVAALAACSGKSDETARSSARSLDSTEVTSGARSDTTHALQSPPTTPPQTQHVLDLAKQYRFVHAWGPVKAAHGIKKNKNTGVLKGKEPKMTLAVAQLKGTITGSDSIVGVIESNGPYPGLGVDTKLNYIYRRPPASGGTGWEVWIVPASGATPVQLERDGMEYSTHPKGRPRLVREQFQKGLHPLVDMIAFGVCIDDPTLCPTGHCGYSQ